MKPWKKMNPDQNWNECLCKIFCWRSPINWYGNSCIKLPPSLARAVFNPNKRQKKRKFKEKRNRNKKSFWPAVLHLLCTSLNLPRPTAPVLVSESESEVKVKVKWKWKWSEVKNFFVPDFAENWIMWSSKEINVHNFRVFWFCKKNVEKNPIQVWKFGKILQRIST